MGTTTDQRAWTVRDTHMDPAVMMRSAVTDEVRAAVSDVDPQCSVV